jgi:hypothetical protein
MNSDPTQPNPANTTAGPADPLAEANQKIVQMSRDLDDLQIEQRLTHKLAAAGVVDLETAVLVAKARLDGQTPADLDGCVARLRKEKAYLFGGSAEVAVPRKTAPVKDRTATRPTALEQAAQQAAKTGSRTDLYHYLKLRKNLR